MREIKFRGKRIDNGEWVTGAYIHNSGKPFIISHEVIDWDDEFFAPEFWWRVDPSTVGQYTGLKDKNGKEIYEGDIVEYKSIYEWEKQPIKKAKVVFENGMFCPPGVIMDLSRSEIIGNIYENPELLI